MCTALVTTTMIFDSWARAPFKENWKLLLSDIPYDFHIADGDDVLPKINSPTSKARHIKHQLRSLRAGNVTLFGSTVKTKPRNSLLVMISVVADAHNQLRSLWRLLSKCFSIATFVTGTAIFASTSLLALPVAVLILVFILAAGILSRAITAWIVSGVSKTEPLLHVIVDSTEEAQSMIASIVSVDEDSGQTAPATAGVPRLRGIQVEMNGHIFVNQTRVHTRTRIDRWWVQTLGILAEPFDLRRVAQSQPVRGTSEPSINHSSEAGSGLLQGQWS